MPHATFAWLRQHAPAYWHARGPQRSNPDPEEPPQRGFWALTRYRDIVAVSKDTDSFSSTRGSMLIRDLDSGRLERMRHWLINLDPPQHTRLRKLIAKAYSPQLIRSFEPLMRNVARQSVDALVGHGACDFAAVVAGPMPFRVTAAILGLPEVDQPMLAAWLDQVVGLEDAEAESAAETQAAASRIFEYLAAFAAEQRRQLRSPLLRALADVEIDGERLDAASMDMFLQLFTMASNETTRNAITCGLHALLQHPDEHRRLVADMGLLETAIDEMLRYDGPAIHMRRTAVRDLEIAGQLIHENDKVVMFYSAGNRDEEVFADPDRFDVGRQPNPHLAFGVGPHFCLGAHQSWNVMRCLFEEMLPRCPDLQLDGPAVYLRSVAIHGIRSLPVRCS